MKPTTCYRIAGYAITDPVQLDYLQRYLMYMQGFVKKAADSNDNVRTNAHTLKLQQIEKVMSEGLECQPLVKRTELHQPHVQYPDAIVQLKEGMYYFPGREPRIFKEEGFYQEIKENPENLPSFTITSIKKIEVGEISDEEEKIYCDEKMYITAEIKSNDAHSTYTFILSIKEDMYICVERVYTSDFGQIIDYLTHTQTYQQLFLQQFFGRRIDLALLGHGHLTKYKDLPVITMPKPIKEI